MLKGHAKIELTDVETGKIQVYEEDNLFTNIIDELVNNNAFALSAVTGDLSGYLPLATRALGGVLLFKEVIEEDPQVMFPPVAPIAYAGDSTDAGTDIRMGTYNKTESKQLTNGYQHIWDFTTSQGNGTIACIGLTHFSVGNGFPGSMYHSLYSNRNSATDTRWFRDFVCMNKYALFFVGFDAESEHIQVRKLNSIVNTLKSVNARLLSPYMNYDKVEGVVIESESDKNIVKNGGIIFEVRPNGHCIGYAHQGNSSGDAYIYTCDIDVNTLTHKEGHFSISGVQLPSFGTGASKAAAIRDHYLYCYKYGDYTKILKINLSNTADITEITVASHSDTSLGYDEVTGYIIVGNQQIIFPNDEVFLARSKFYDYSAHNTVVREGAKELIRRRSYSSSPDNHQAVVFNRSYLATINNLTTPVVKTAAQTMKITYTITDSDEISLLGISVTTEPNVKRYPVGEHLSLAGMEVTAVYSDASKKALSAEDYKTTPLDNAQLLDTALQNVTVAYTDNDITRYALQPIVVYALAALDVITQPDKITYYEGDELDLAGLLVQATYTDEVLENVTDRCSFSPADKSILPAELAKVVATYSAGQVTKTADIPITVIARVLERIDVTANPKTSYKPGEQLDLSGMVVTATYNSGKQADVTSSVIATPANGTTLNDEGETVVKLEYTERGVKKETTLTVYVTAGVVLAYLSIESNPTKMTYREGEALDLEGLQILAHYTDGATKTVTGSCVFDPANGATLDTPGSQIVTATYTEQGVTKSVTLSVTVEEKPPIEIVSWADGTDEQIAAMVAALDAGTLTVEETGWKVGDVRTVQLSAMEKTGVGESHAAQTVQLVLSHAGATAGISRADGKPIHFQVDQVASLNESGYMNSSNTNSGSWEGSARRTWCNAIYYGAIPETLRSIFKKMKVTTAATYNGSTLKESEDFFALRAEKEIFGTRSYSNSTEAAALEQVEWYKTAANRKKLRSGSADYWWERSPRASSSGNFCYVDSDGGVNWSSASTTYGLAPFGCI